MLLIVACLTPIDHEGLRLGFGGQKLQIIYNFYTRNVHVYFQIQILIYKDFSS